MYKIFIDPGDVAMSKIGTLVLLELSSFFHIPLHTNANTALLLKRGKGVVRWSSVKEGMSQTPSKLPTLRSRPSRS